MSLPKYTVIKSVRLVHKATGRAYSIYGACPWTGAKGDTAEDYERRVVGYTVRNNRDGTVGIGRMPWTSKDQADAWATKANGA